MLLELYWIQGSGPFDRLELVLEVHHIVPVSFLHQVPHLSQTYKAAIDSFTVDLARVSTEDYLSRRAIS